MIRVSMQLDQFGLGEKVTQLADVTITNDGTGTATRGNYDVIARNKTGRVIRRARLEHWPRTARPPLALLLAALRNMGYA